VAAAVLLAHGLALPLYSLWVTRNIPKIMRSNSLILDEYKRAENQ
jgi:hypothetical protein